MNVAFVIVILPVVSCCRGFQTPGNHAFPVRLNIYVQEWSPKITLWTQIWRKEDNQSSSVCTLPKNDFPKCPRLHRHRSEYKGGYLPWTRAILGRCFAFMKSLLLPLLPVCLAGTEAKACPRIMLIQSTFQATDVKRLSNGNAEEA